MIRSSDFCLIAQERAGEEENLLFFWECRFTYLAFACCSFHRSPFERLACLVWLFPRVTRGCWWCWSLPMSAQRLRMFLTVPGVQSSHLIITSGRW